MTSTRRRDPRLDETPGAERRYSGRQVPRPAGGIGGSNRLLTVDELAQYLGVPKKTIYGCWQEWGLKAYKVGRHLRFRERHVEDWLRSREA
jgi:excisionase family DNA binding protein